MSAETITNTDLENVTLVVVGDGAVGKTSLLLGFTSGGFNGKMPPYLPTVFDDYRCMLKVQLENSNAERLVSLQLSDTAGQEDYASLRPLAYPGADAFVLCFALDSPTSFANLESKWLPELHHFAPSKPIVLVGTKSDRRDVVLSQRLESLITSDVAVSSIVDEQHVQALLKRHTNIVEFLECSAMTGKNLKAVFDTTVVEVLEKRQRALKGDQSGRKNKKCLIL